MSRARRALQGIALYEMMMMMMMMMSNTAGQVSTQNPRFEVSFPISSISQDRLCFVKASSFKDGGSRISSCVSRQVSSLFQCRTESENGSLLSLSSPESSVQSECFVSLCLCCRCRY